MYRTSLLYLLIVIIVGLGVFTWKSHDNTADPISAAQPSASRTPRQTPSTVHQAPRLHFVTDTGLPYQVRITQLRHTLATGCSEPEIRFLYQLLKDTPPKSELLEHWYVIANDIMTQILSHETDSRRFCENFTGLLNSPRQPEVIRDYAVQHLADWLNPRSSQATAARLPVASSEIADQVLRDFATAAIDPSLEKTSIPGTILMMLVDLKRSGSEVDCNNAIITLKPWLTQALQDQSPLGNPIRVSAVVAAGILAPEEFRPLIRNIAYEENSDSSLRLPAIAAIGHAGDAADLPNLNKIASASPELSYAAQDAAIALTSRLNASH